MQKRSFQNVKSFSSIVDRIRYVCKRSGVSVVMQFLLVRCLLNCS